MNTRYSLLIQIFVLVRFALAQHTPVFRASKIAEAQRVRSRLHREALQRALAHRLCVYCGSLRHALVGSTLNRSSSAGKRAS